MALLTPFLWVVPDPRILFFIQVVGFAIAGLLPDDAAVSAQVAFTAQVAQREILFLYPWNELDDAVTIPSEPGQTVRVSLFWRAIAAPNGERTVSLRISDAAGNIVAQNDSAPAEASRPTSWWQ